MVIVIGEIFREEQARGDVHAQAVGLGDDVEEGRVVREVAVVHAARHGDEAPQAAHLVALRADHPGPPR